ncbi:MAG: LacI family DNA-binding transcriptional regulator [Bacteroidota bacterium]
MNHGTRHPATIRDVARAAGVSLGAASQALNNRPGVSEELREKVRRAAEQLNYSRYHAARKILGSGTRTLAFICFRLHGWPSPQDIFLSPILMSMAETARSHNHLFQLQVFDQMDRSHRQQAIRDFLESSLCDGYVLYVFSQLNEIDVLELNEIGVPYVVMGKAPSLMDTWCAHVDNRRGGYEATAHLIKLGRRRIAFISGPGDSLDSLNRLRGYREALEEHGVAFDPRLIGRGDYAVEEGYRAMRQILAAGGERPDGVFGADDRIAQGAVRALADAGIRVPDEVAVIGFDDSVAAVCSQPSLTTMHQPLYDLGKATVDLLVERIGNPGAPARQVCLQPTLVIRQSCPPGRGD